MHLLIVMKNRPIHDLSIQIRLVIGKPVGHQSDYKMPLQSCSQSDWVNDGKNPRIHGPRKMPEIE